MATFQSVEITQGTYNFLGRDLPEVEISSDTDGAGPATLSFLFDLKEQTVAFNMASKLQGSSSNVLPIPETEAFLLACLKVIQENK